MWKFVNSPFVIWALSSVVIALLSTSYSWYQNQIQNKNAIRKLELEISLRLNNFISYSENNLSYLDSKEAILALEVPVKSKLSFSLYHENRNRGVTSLLLDYRDLLISYKLTDTWSRYQGVDRALFLWREELVDLQKYIASNDKKKMAGYINILRKQVKHLSDLLQLEHSISSKYGGRKWNEDIN